MAEDSTSQPPRPVADAVSGSTTPDDAPADAAHAFAAARAMLAAGRHEDARASLRTLIAEVPMFEAAWLQLLALDPPLAEEIELLEGFLQHHPQHRFAQAFEARLHDQQIVMLLTAAQSADQPATEEPAVSVRLGNFLIKKNWVTPEQVEHALKEQQRLRAAGFEQRLGTILLMQGHLQLDQLATALSSALADGFGEFGDYLVRTRVLTREQVAQALAHQSALRAEYDQEYLEMLTGFYRESRKETSRPSRLLSAPPQRKHVPRLGAVMVDMGLLSREQVEEILQEREKMFNSLFE